MALFNKKFFSWNRLDLMRNFLATFLRGQRTQIIIIQNVGKEAIFRSKNASKSCHRYNQHVSLFALWGRTFWWHEIASEFKHSSAHSLREIVRVQIKSRLSVSLSDVLVSEMYRTNPVQYIRRCFLRDPEVIAVDRLNRGWWMIQNFCDGTTGGRIRYIYCT